MDGGDRGEAATRPVAAGRALRTLEQAGPLLGRRVLATGATGAAPSLPVAEVVIGPDTVTEPVDVVIDTVGGSQLAVVHALLERGGVQGRRLGRRARIPSGEPGGRRPPTRMEGEPAVRTATA
jgi:NADPH2:quinone reductase